MSPPSAHLLLCCLLQGKYVVLFFYPLDFTFVCPTEITGTCFILRFSCHACHCLRTRNSDQGWETERVCPDVVRSVL